jgi:hypothetical protein
MQLNAINQEHDQERLEEAVDKSYFDWTDECKLK